MTGMILERRLSAVSRRIHRLRILRRQTTCWLVVMVPAVMLCLLLPATGLRLSLRDSFWPVGDRPSPRGWRRLGWLSSTTQDSRTLC